MPGSHDASLYHSVATGQGFARFKYSTFICQDRSIFGQCQSGSRFFDIRLTGTDGMIRGYHTAIDSRGIFATGGLGAEFYQILDDVYYFLGSNQTEFVILRFSHTHAITKAGSIINVMMRYITELNKLDFSLKLYTHIDPDKNLAKVPIKNFRGKLICIFDTREFRASIAPAMGIHAFSKYPSNNPIEGLSICGEFSSKSKIADVERIQNGRITEHNEHDKSDHLFQLYWTQSNGMNIERDTKAVRNSAHSEIRRKLESMRTSQEFPNIVLYDFVNDKTSEIICNMNFALNRAP
jgi:hypothetical protein